MSCIGLWLICSVLPRILVNLLWSAQIMVQVAAFCIDFEALSFGGGGRRINEGPAWQADLAEQQGSGCDAEAAVERLLA